MKINGNNELIAHKKNTGGHKGKDSFKWTMFDANSSYTTTELNDTTIARQVLFKKGLSHEDNNFSELAKIRNGLPLIHGKTESTGSTSDPVEHVTDSDISKLVDILTALVDHPASSIQSETG